MEVNVERQILRVNILRFFPRVVKRSLRSSIIISSYIHINDGRVFFFSIERYVYIDTFDLSI